MMTFSELTNCPVTVLCPKCQSETVICEGDQENQKISCAECQSNYSLENGFANLVVGERFEDASDEECLCYEEDSNEYTTNHFWIPLFKDTLKAKQGATLLSIGCGIGREVDMLNQAGLNCIGIDNGNRAKIWPAREYGNHLIMANGMHLPFPQETFDYVFCGCVFPHVGVVGDSAQVKDNYFEERAKLASEMSRVLKPGGKIIMASPNRLFPFDLFHGREAGSYTPRFNRPGERNLLSYRDYKKIFLSNSVTKSRLLPVTGYWGFVRSKSSLKGLLLGMPIRFIFNLISTKTFAFLRGTAISPWLTVQFQKNDDTSKRATN